VGRNSFRMQIAGTPGPVTEVTAVPVLMPHTPTERIIDRRQRIERRQSTERRQKSAFPPAADGPAGVMPALSKRALIGLSLITFSSGILVATAIYRLRPSPTAARLAPVEQVAPAPAPAVVQIQALPNPGPLAPRSGEGVRETGPQPAPAVAPAASEPASAPEMAAAVAVIPAAAKPAATVHVRPTPPVVRLKRPVQPTDGRVAAPRPTEPAPFAQPKPASKKWVDPFAE
jgi:hypothetical protein